MAARNITMKSKALTLPEDFDTIDALRNDAHQTAAIVRQTFWSGRYPVDPVKIALALGAEVYEAQLGSDIFGALLQDSEGSMRIYIDKDQPASRYRFSAAHELGHYVDRSRRLEVLPRDIDRRSSKMPDFNIAEGKREIWAIEFAAELLMPRIEIQQQRKNGNTSPVHLAQRFNVPLPVMNHRIHTLN
jgi:putative toxin-antitoxin system, toxin component